MKDVHLIRFTACIKWGPLHGVQVKVGASLQYTDSGRYLVDSCLVL